jgi:hypothetical protein
MDEPDSKLLESRIFEALDDQWVTSGVRLH